MAATIFALSSGQLPSGVAVIRISGPGSAGAIRALGSVLPAERRAAVRRLHLPDGTLLDRALVLFFAKPTSATGEDCLELHLHGGRAVVAKALEVLAAQPGFRHAEPGEFTRRGFLNGKMDLVEAESLADLINADTEAQRRFAVLNGGVLQSELYAGWRARLLHARAMIEAELDFADESDVPGSVSDVVWKDVAELKSAMVAHLQGFTRAEIVRHGYRVVLVGPPNAGKSSLINALARRDVAIVSSEPGTTRDVIEVNLDLGGFKVVLSDTAGIREGATGIEAIGIGRTHDAAGRADLILVLEPWGVEAEILSGIPATNVLPIVSKVDLASEQLGAGVIGVSAVNGAGLGELLEEIGRRASAAADGRGEALPTRERHVWLFQEGVRELDRALDEASALELRAEALRLADRAVGRVIGAVDAEDVLGAVFSQFCIGK